MPIEVDTLVVDHLTDMIDEPGQCLRVSQIQQSPALVVELVARIWRCGEQPLRMPLEEPGTGSDPLRFEPDDRLELFRMSMIGYGAKPWGNRWRSTSQVPVLVQEPLL